jgi:hypothetical protein
VGSIFYVPALVGSANNGSRCGLSVSNSNNVASNANPNYGAALTPKLLRDSEQNKIYQKMTSLLIAALCAAALH